ncbi:FAD-dependent monooxygenase [Deinococcus maricopensis]|uniref:Fumarate reductase/succinate dehydrogenase flavoprotein domain protein n=1 Tax=Deinococcus maricopensis (strain DSM 21211 / LMG 22137 / NRRL B-23946 / LB-34) TaxID=709986 RepID=E8U446_DEIML|nr:FAD-dependent monooxygenase [Deinococcus maricopensis]ADV65883.1 fumarate reductase/succinate dehydrogenase flavoprotein domain protein [Deinococcus maricopensis DSM 21211]
MRTLIIGAGLAGLTAALALHHLGVEDIVILEKARALRPLGSGINVLPLAVRELDALGVLDDLVRDSVQLRELQYLTPRGQGIWAEQRGVHAGFRWPQLSISRGVLQQHLLRHVTARLGAGAVRTGAEVHALEPRARGRRVVCRDGRTFDADLVIGADGIRSATRQAAFPEAGGLQRNGLIIYRGAVWDAPFLDGRTMYIAGDTARKFVLYPMQERQNGREALQNWAVALPAPAGDDTARGHWNVPVNPEAFVDAFRGWTLPGVNVHDLIGRTPDVYAYPMVDIDPLPTWTDGDHLVLIGDAAHAMYPIGSNGGTQSIVDAAALAAHLARAATPAEALRAFDADRRPKMHRLQAANRHKGPEVVIDLASARRPHGFGHIDEVFSPQELQDIADRYAQDAAMSLHAVNATPRLLDPATRPALRTP